MMKNEQLIRTKCDKSNELVDDTCWIFIDTFSSDFLLLFDSNPRGYFTYKSFYLTYCYRYPSAVYLSVPRVFPVRFVLSIHNSCCKLICLQISLYLTKEQRIFLVKQWWTSGKNFRAVNGAFRNEFLDKKMPTRQAIYKLLNKFADTQKIHE